MPAAYNASISCTTGFRLHEEYMFIIDIQHVSYTQTCSSSVYWLVLRTALQRHQHSTDAPSILRTSSILGVSSTSRTASTGSMSGTEGLNTGSMNSTEGLNTAITGIMISKSSASTGVSAVLNPEILGEYRGPAVQNP